MKRILTAFGLCLLLGTLLACGPTPAPPKLIRSPKLTATPIQLTQESELQQVKTPIWSEEDEEDFKLTFAKIECCASVGVSFMSDPDIRPPFYEGAMPLTYDTYN